MWPYLAWAGLISATLGAATFATLSAWNRRVLRERAVAQRLVESVEAARRREAEAERRAIQVLADSERRHRALAEARAVAVFLADAEGRTLRLDGPWEELTGQPAREVLNEAMAWVEMIHPEERAATSAAWLHAIRTGGTYEAEYRLRDAAHGGWRWCRARAVPIRAAPGQGEAEGPILEWVGVIEDMDARRRAEAQRMLVAREVNHRAKNALAVVQAVVRLSGGGNAEAAGISDRIAALARAHDLLARAEWRGAGLRELAERELVPFMGPRGGPRISLAGEEVMLQAQAVQPIGMLLHELGTNAAKHGALASGGRVEVSWRVARGALELCWTERGATVPVSPPTRRGFGSQLLEMTVRGQLGGRLERSWPPTGLVCRITLPASRTLAAQAHRAARLETQDPGE